jgi:transcriptional repressor CTCF
MLIHTDQKPFECQYCEQTFRQKQLLKRHENIYHNPEYVAAAPREKNHNCPTCDKAFRHKGNLMRHMAAHDLQAGKKSTRVKAEQSGEDYVVVEVFHEEEQYEDEEDEAMELQEEEEDMTEQLEQIVEEDNYTLTESE